MISLIFTRKKLLVGISGKVTEFLEIDGSPFIEFGYKTPAEALEQNLNEILNEYKYYINRNGEVIPEQINLSILYPNDRPAAELAQIQEIIRRSSQALSIVHIDSLVLPYLYGMSHYDEIISSPCIVLEALDNYISLLYFHNPKKVNGSFLPIEENNLPTEYLKEKLSPQRLESMGIGQVFLLGKYLYNDFVLDFLENDLSLGNFIVRKNTSHLTDYKFMIKGSQRRMKDFSINPSERLADWNKTLARIQIPVSKKEKKQIPSRDSSAKIEEAPKDKTSQDTSTRLSGKVDNRKLEISQNIPTEESNGFKEQYARKSKEAQEAKEAEQKSLYEIAELKLKIDKQTELYNKMADSFEESSRRGQESMLRVRETEAELKRLKKSLQGKEQEVEELKRSLANYKFQIENLKSQEANQEQLQSQTELATELKKELAAKEIEAFDLQQKLKQVSVLEGELEAKTKEIEELQEKLKQTSEIEHNLKEKQREIAQLTEGRDSLKEGTDFLKRKIEGLEGRIKEYEQMLAEKDESLAQLDEIDSLRKDDIKEKNSLKQELEVLLTRYKLQQDVLDNKDKEFAEFKEKRIEAEQELKKEIEQREENIEQLKEDIKNRQFKHNDELKIRLAEIDELKSNVDSRDHKIEKLNKEKEKLVAQNSETEGNLNDRILELKAINVRLKVKELEVQELDQGLRSREEEIKDLGDQMVEKNRMISEKESSNRVLKGDVNSLKDQILALELTVKKNEGDIKVKEDEVAILKKDINQLKIDAENNYRLHEKQQSQLVEKLKSLKDELTEGNEKIGQLETSIRLKEKEVQQQIEKYKIEKDSKQVLSHKLLSVNKRLEEFKNTLQEKEEKLARALPELEKSKIRLIDLSSVIEKQRSAENEYKTQIIEQQKKLSIGEKDIAAKISELNKLKERFVNSEKQLSESKKQVEDYHKSIQDLNKTVQTKEERLNELNQKLKKSDEEIDELKTKLDLSTSRWADIGLALKGRDEHIIHLEEELLSLREVKKVLNTDIDQLSFELHDAKAKVEVYIAERNVAEARANELSLQVKRLESMSRSTQHDNEIVADLQTTVRNLNRELNNRDGKIQQFRNELGAKEKEVDLLSKRLETQRMDLAVANKSQEASGKTAAQTKSETTSLERSLNLMKAELEVKNKELKEMQTSRQELKQKFQRLEESKTNGADQNRFQKMIEGKNEVIRALKIKLGEKDKELQSSRETAENQPAVNNSEEIKTLTEKLKESEMAKEKLSDELKKTTAQIEDQEALRKKLLEMEKEMVVQRGRTKSRLEALEAELAKAFEEKPIDSSDINPYDKFQETV